jgi:hypothetical protein
VLPGVFVKENLMSKSVFIHELVQEGDRWRMSIGEVGSTEELYREMYPLGTMAPYGVTIEEEMVQYDPVIGHFYIKGITEDAVRAMEPGFSEAFRSYGFLDRPAEGMVRTWIPHMDAPWDMSEQEASELYVDNYVEATLPNLSEMTIWDKLQDQIVEFRYANGKTFSIRLGDIEQDDRPASFLWNDSNFLVVPVDDNWMPVINARTALNMFQLRYGLEQADAQIRDDQLEIGFLVYTFSEAIKRLATESQYSDPRGAMLSQ